MGTRSLGSRQCCNTSSQWSKDLSDQRTNLGLCRELRGRFTAACPRYYASRGSTRRNLELLSALAVAEPSDADAFREALRAADFDSTRGDFAFGPNHHPIQDIYAREVIKEGDVFTNRIIGVALENHADAYASECSM